MKVLFKKLRDDAVLPEYKTPASAGLDLTVPHQTEEIHFQPGETVIIPLGFQVEIPPGYVGRMVPRSSMFKKGWRVAGEIDSDYRGEVGLMLQAPVFVNHRATSFDSVHGGDRVAQMIITPAPQFEVEWADELTDTVRGDGGFGSTGGN